MNTFYFSHYFNFMQYYAYLSYRTFFQLLFPGTYGYWSKLLCFKLQIILPYFAVLQSKPAFSEVKC